MLEHYQLVRRQMTLDSIWKMLDLKTTEIRLINPNINLVDVAHYFLKVILIDKDNIDINWAAYYIFNIKINWLIEFLNSQAISNKELNLAEFSDMFK